MIEFGILELSCLLKKLAGLTDGERVEHEKHQTKHIYFIELFMQKQA